MKSSDWQFEVKVEYTERATPQQNSYAENSFTVLSARGRACMNAACVPIEKRYLLWPECIVTVSKFQMSFSLLQGRKNHHWQKL